MKKRNILLIGIIGLTLFIGATSGFAKSLTQKITVRFTNIKLIVNDQVIKTTAEPFVYNGNVYAPVATIANALGLQQEWDNRSAAVRVSTSSVPTEFKKFDGGGIDDIHKIENSIYWKTRMNKGANYSYSILGMKNGSAVEIPLIGFGPEDPEHTMFTKLLDFNQGDNGELYLLVSYEVYKENDFEDGSYAMELDHIQLSTLKYKNGDLFEVNKYITEKLPNSQRLLYGYDNNTLWTSIIETTNEGQKLVRTDLLKWDNLEIKNTYKK